MIKAFRRRRGSSFKMKKYNTLLLICLLVTGLISGSLQTANAEKGGDPRRIVSLAPSVTEILYALELGERIVGVTDFCNYPKEAKAKPKVGGFFNPDIETIVSLKPDLIIGMPNLGNKRVIQGLSSLDVPILTVTSFTISDVLNSILIIGRRCGVVQRAERLVSGLQKRIERIKVLTKDAKKTRVLFVFSYEPLITAGRGTFIDEFISLSGGVNIAEDTRNRYSRRSIEEIIVKQPEIIITTTNMNSFDAQNSRNVTAWKRWKDLPAVKSGRVFGVNGDFFLRPGPRIVIGLEKIAEMIHPEVF